MADAPISPIPWRYFRYCIWDAESSVIAVIVCPPRQEAQFEANTKLFEKAGILLELTRHVVMNGKPEHLAALRRLVYEIDGLAEVKNGE